MADVEKMIDDDSRQAKKRLLRREAYWINRLETLLPKGMNENCNLSLARLMVFFFDSMSCYAFVN